MVAKARPQDKTSQIELVCNRPFTALAASVAMFINHCPDLLPPVVEHAKRCWAPKVGQERAREMLNCIAAALDPETLQKAYGSKPSQPDSKPLSPPEGPDAHEE